MKGKLIVLEGGEGCGKGTQQKLLEEFLKSKGKEVILLRDPGSTSIGEQIRKIILNPENTEIAKDTELLLYFAAKAQMLKEQLLPAIESGKWVILDRFYHSTFVYQGFANNVDIKIIEELRKIILHNIKPSITLILDVPVEIGFERVEKIKKKDRQESKSKEFHERVRKGYLKLSELLKDENIVVIDASQPIQEVFEAAKKEIEKII